MTLIFLRGATGYEFQVWRVWGHWPYWRFMKVGCRPSIHFAAKETGDNG